MKHFVGKYPNHYCELRLKQIADMTFLQTVSNTFKSMFLISEKNYRSFNYYRSRGEINLELIKQVNSGYWYIFHPFSLPRVVWEYVMVLGTLIAFLMTPIRILFCNYSVAKYYIMRGRQPGRYREAYIMVAFMAVLSYIDILFNFVTGFYDPAINETVLSPKKIAKNYLKFEFFVDFLTFVPIEPIMALFYGLEDLVMLNFSFRLFLMLYNILTPVRFRRYIKYFIVQKNFKSLNSYALHRVAIWLFFFVLLVHWIICFCMSPLQIYFIETLRIEDVNNTSHNFDQRTFLDKSFEEQYLFMLTLVFHTQIFGSGIISQNETDTLYYTWEMRIMAIILSVVMRALWVYLLILMMEITTAKTALKVKIILVLYHLKSYMKFKDIPAVLKKRLNRFYLYRFLAYYFRDRAIMGRLTEPLRKEISMYTCQRLIYNTNIFQSVPRKVLTRIVSAMHREMYFPNDVIVRVNTFGESMYFICSGTVSVTTNSDREVAFLEDGEFFGEIALISEDRRRTATVTAVTISEVYRLEAVDFKKIIEKFPDVYRRLEKYAVERYQILVAIEKKPRLGKKLANIT